MASFLEFGAHDLAGLDLDELDDEPARVERWHEVDQQRPGVDRVILEQLDAALAQRRRGIGEVVDLERDVVQPAEPLVEPGQLATGARHDELDRRTGTRGEITLRLVLRDVLAGAAGQAEQLSEQVDLLLVRDDDSDVVQAGLEHVSSYWPHPCSRWN